MKTTFFGGTQFPPFESKAYYVTLLTNITVYLCPGLVNCFVCLRYKMEPIMSSSLFEITEHVCYSANRHTCVTTTIYDDQLQNVENVEKEISICILLN